MGLGRHLSVLKSAWGAETERRNSLSGQRKRGTETEFLPEALEIVETPPSPIGRIILWVIILFFVLAVIWSIWGKIDIVATGQGRVIPKGQTQIVEAREAGIVTSINIRNGDFVKAGDVLLELDPTIASADSEAVDNELKQAQTRAAIAKGMIRYLDHERISFEKPEGISKSVANVSERQLKSRIMAFSEEKMLLLEEKNRVLASFKSVQNEISKIRDTLPLMRERTRSYGNLAKEGLAPKVEAMRLEEDLITRQKDLEIAHGRLTEVRSEISAAERRLLLLSQQFRREALTELAEAEAIRSDRIEAKKKASVRNSWQMIRAPVDGTIVGLQVFTIGDVLEPGAPVMMIAPEGEELIVESMILNKDIGFVRKGDDVAVKLEAYPFTRYGLIEGELTMISADAIVDENLGPVFPAEVTLSKAYVGEGNLRRDIQSGMNATTEIKTGDRRIIDFLLSPISKASKEAARER